VSTYNKQRICALIAILWFFVTLLVMNYADAANRKFVFLFLALPWMLGGLIATYIVILCPKCQWPVMAKPENQFVYYWRFRKTCPKCGASLQ